MNYKVSAKYSKGRNWIELEGTDSDTGFKN